MAMVLKPSLLADSKTLSPFGIFALALREKLLDQYPGLRNDGGSKWSEAVCRFLCDFVLDMGDLQSTSSDQGETSSNPTDNHLQTTRGDRSVTEPGNGTPVEEDLKGDR